MDALANDDSPDSSPIQQALNDLALMLDDWQSHDWTGLNVTAADVENVLLAIDKLHESVEHAARSRPDLPARNTGEAREEGSGLNGASILLAEDNTVNRMVADGMLRQFHCEIDVAENGEEAVRRFQESNYDLIFMDCQMPVLDGYDAVARIRQIEAERNVDSEQRIPIVALTANALKGDRERCIASGMDDYVSKPFSVADLRDALDRQLGSDRTAELRSMRAAHDEQTATHAVVSTEEGDFIDTDVLSAILKLTNSGGAALLDRVIDVYLESSPRLVEELKNALEAGDVRATATAAHAVRSACGSIGAFRLDRLCKAIESIAKADRIVDAKEWSGQLARCHELTASQLRQYRDGASGQ